ncbi:MAG: AAA family ATPase [Candidatus Marsarchaeota archaeon]|nr:AAA family ATPase [Candidatus Marsarchaeota archaeon]
MKIGLTGTFASGKSLTSQILQKQGFEYYSLSEEVRDECEKRGLPPERKNLFNIANELRENYGPQVLAERVVKKIEMEKPKNAVIDGIRSPEEVWELEKMKKFTLISIDAPIETRYERTMKRKRASEENQTFEEFKKSEQKEWESNNQNIKGTISLSKIKIINDSTKEELESKINKIIKTLKA